MTRNPYFTVAAWSLVVALGGTAVATLSSQAWANNQAQKVLKTLTNQAQSTTTVVSNAVPNDTGAMLAHTCAACHGTEGRLGDEAFMPLAGMPVSQFVNTMVAFREGKRPSTLMGHVARGFSDDELRAMGEYFGAVAPQGVQP